MKNTADLIFGRIITIILFAFYYFIYFINCSEYAPFISFFWKIWRKCIAFKSSLKFLLRYAKKNRYVIKKIWSNNIIPVWCWWEETQMNILSWIHPVENDCNGDINGCTRIVMNIQHHLYYDLSQCRGFPMPFEREKKYVWFNWHSFLRPTIFQFKDRPQIFRLNERDCLYINWNRRTRTCCLRYQYLTNCLERIFSLDVKYNENERKRSCSIRISIDTFFTFPSKIDFFIYIYISSFRTV